MRFVSKEVCLKKRFVSKEVCLKGGLSQKRFASKEVCPRRGLSQKRFVPNETGKRRNLQRKEGNTIRSGHPSLHKWNAKPLVHSGRGLKLNTVNCDSNVPG